jgi:hypothetical protein
MDSSIFPLRITGILAILGATLYAIGDVLLLASKVSLDDYPKLKPYAKLFSYAEKMVVLSPNRKMWGALLWVFATTLVLAGYWQIYNGLLGANEVLVLTTTLLFVIPSVIGAFVHGTFYYMGEYVRALNLVDEFSQVVIADMIKRHRKVFIITYAPLLTLIVIASILFSVMVGMGNTQFPIWMAAINSVTMTIAWLLIKRILPQFIRDATEGAGFTFAYFIFFACTTFTLWNA